MNKKITTKQMVTTGMMSAVAYLLMFFIRLPGPANFLTYDPKDVAIALLGFLIGPLWAASSCIVVAFLEMVTVSRTSIIGFVMNALSSLAFVLPISFICNNPKRKTLIWAVTGLITGVATVTVTMTFWNILITPLYMKIPNMTVSEIREMVKGMLMTVFIPFNLVKSSLNACVIALVCVPMYVPLRKASLI